MSHLPETEQAASLLLASIQIGPVCRFLSRLHHIPTLPPNTPTPFLSVAQPTSTSSPTLFLGANIEYFTAFVAVAGVVAALWIWLEDADRDGGAGRYGDEGEDTDAGGEADADTDADTGKDEDEDEDENKDREVVAALDKLE